MKRFAAICLSVICLVSLLSGCGRNNQEEQNPIIVHMPGVTEAMYDAAYWTGKVKEPDVVLMDADDIELFNEQTVAKSGGEVVDLVGYASTVTGTQLKRWLGEAQLPASDLYAADGSLYGEGYFDELVVSVNAEGVADSNKVSFAIAAANAPVRLFPTMNAAYEDMELREEDVFQQGMLLVGEAVVVLHMNFGQDWFYVQSANQRGWVRMEDLILMEKGSWVSYQEETLFLVVTAPSITLEVDPYNPAVSGQTLYMGTKLPLYDDDHVGSEISGRGSEGCYVVQYPTLNSFGYLEYQPALIPISDDVSIGYLDYTPANVVRQAMSLVGARNCVNRLAGGRDNAAFVVDIYRVFGITMPSTTAQQKKLTAIETDMASESSDERLKTLTEANPGSLLFSGDQAFIYLGMDEKVPYVVAPVPEYYYDNKAHVTNSCILTSLEVVRRDGTAFLDSLRSLKVLGVEEEKEDEKDGGKAEGDVKTTTKAAKDAKEDKK
ncbi:MAG: SH3 domain-containing protein [Clostridia bacterium]|nr:SH3 domain-containing protein [Clostridia bacterium]